MRLIEILCHGKVALKQHNNLQFVYTLVDFLTGNSLWRIHSWKGNCTMDSRGVL